MLSSFSWINFAHNETLALNNSTLCELLIIRINEWKTFVKSIPSTVKLNKQIAHMGIFKMSKGDIVTKIVMRFINLLIKIYKCILIILS